MRRRHVLIFLLGSVAYIVLAYFILVVLPDSLISDSAYGQVSDTNIRYRYIVDARNSVRTSAVAVLTGSALGVAGLVAALTFFVARRDETAAQRKSQDDLYSTSLGQLKERDPAVVVGALALMTNIAVTRRDLRAPTAAILFLLIRSGIHLDGPVVDLPEEREVAELIDRQPIPSAALSFAGQIPLDGGFRVEGGNILRRRLDTCDFRKWSIDGARFELVDFLGSYFWGAKVIDCIFVKCVFAQTDWAGARLRRVEFHECDMNLADLSSAELAEVTFYRCIGRD
jgi:hypothetical protein